MADFNILAFQNPEFKILADFKILGFQNPEFKILADFNIQARPGGVVGYQYTRYFAPKIPIILFQIILKQNTKYLKMNKLDLHKREIPGSPSSSASFAVG